MALIKCANCGHMISDKATKCPKCGADQTLHADSHPIPIEEEKKSSCTLVYIIIAVAVIAACVASFFIFHGKSNSPLPVNVDSLASGSDAILLPDTTDSVVVAENPNDTISAEEYERQIMLSWLEGRWIESDKTEGPREEIAIKGNRIYIGDFSETDPPSYEYVIESSHEWDYNEEKEHADKALVIYDENIPNYPVDFYPIDTKRHVIVSSRNMWEMIKLQ